MFSSLAMYDFPHIRWAWEKFYRQFAGIARDYGLSPPDLIWGEEALDWGGDVFLAMCCGAPFRNIFFDHLELVGTLDFGLVEGHPGYYYSEILCAPQWLGVERGTAEKAKPASAPPVLAANDPGSQSGYHAPLIALGEAGIHPEIRLSGSHQASLEMLRAGKADFCGIDAQSFRFICECAPELGDMPHWGRTAPTPGLPLVSARREEAPIIAQALRDCVAGLEGKTAAALHIQGMVEIEREAYMAVKNAPEPKAL